MGGSPGLLDFVNPTWMLNRDPDPSIEATSWRLSLRACLVRTEVLRQMGSVQTGFRTLEAAALEMGHGYISRGVFTRYVPWLVPSHVKADPAIMPFEDELRFVYYRVGAFWSRWALGRAILSGYVAPRVAYRAWSKVARSVRPQERAPFLQADENKPAPLGDARVTVLIPTLDRYPYLRVLLHQLRRQTVQPHEIIVIDQTAQERRDTTLASEFDCLPLQVLYRDQPGQCSSRNAGLEASTGDYILFIDDDDEVKPDLIELHLKSLDRFSADASCGVAEEVGAGPLPEGFRYVRMSDVFPTDDTLVRRDLLVRSGLFDLAYDRGQRADGDLGMRAYMSGAYMVLNPQISVLHHHAPQGGLRAHKARVITYASSRQNLRHRQLPSVSDVYLAMRYFTPRQVREMLWLGAFGTFSIRGSLPKKLLKMVMGAFYLPNTIWQIKQRRAAAAAMLSKYPVIPELPSQEDISPEHQNAREVTERELICR